MKALVAKTQLTKALEFVSMANYKTDNGEDNAIMISCDNYVLTLTGGNEENHIEMVIEAEVEETGAIVVNSTNLDKQIKGFPGKEIVITGNSDFMYFETSEDVDDSMKCNMKVDSAESTKFADYTASKSTPCLTVNANTLADALAAAAIAVDKKSPKEELKNVGLILNKDTVEFVGFSSKRLSKQSIKTNGTNEVEGEKRFTIPLTVAKNVAKMFKKGKKDVSLCLEKNEQGNYLVFKNEVATIFCKLLHPTYPSFSRLLENKAEYSINFSAANLTRIIKGLSGMSKADVVVTLTPTDKSMEFSIINDGSKMALSIGCNINGEKTTIKMLGKDLKEAFGCVNTDTCTLNVIRNTVYTLVEDNGDYIFMGSLCK